MRRLPASKALLDNLHKGVVLCCMGVTLYGLSVGAVRAFKLFTKERPQGAASEKTSLETK